MTELRKKLGAVSIDLTSMLTIIIMVSAAVFGVLTWTSNQIADAVAPINTLNATMQTQTTQNTAEIANMKPELDAIYQYYVHEGLIVTSK